MALLVNGEYVGDERLIEEFHRIGALAIDPSSRGATEALQALHSLAEQRVLYAVLLRQMAVAAGFTASDEEVSARWESLRHLSSASVCSPAMRQTLKEDLLVETFSRWLVRHEPRPSRAEVESFYETHRHEFLRPEQREIAHIIHNCELPGEEVTALDSMRRAQEELGRGTPFPEVADRYSDCGQRGRLGWISRGDMVEEFDEVVFALPLQRPSAIFQTRFGFHIAMVLQTRAAGYQLLREARSGIAHRLLQQRQLRAIRLAVDNARRRSSIVPAALPISPEESA